MYNPIKVTITYTDIETVEAAHYTHGLYSLKQLPYSADEKELMDIMGRG